MLGVMFLMDCSKLEAMAIYLVKQACGNDILVSVYDLKPSKYMIIQCCYFLLDSMCRRINERSKCVLIALLSLCKCRSYDVKKPSNETVMSLFCLIKSLYLENIFFENITV